MKQVTAVLVVLLAIIISSTATFAATTYYSQGSLAPNLTTSWNTVRAGGGTAPSNFTTGDVFVIQNGHNMTTSATWSVSGTGSKVWIEAGGTLTATSAITLNAATTFQIDSLGSYVHNNTSAYGSTIFPSAGTRSFHAASTVTIKATNTTLPTGITFGNLTMDLSTDPAANFSWAGGLTTVNGNLTVTNTQTREMRLVANSPSTLSVTVAKDVIVNGGILNLCSGTSVLTLNIGGNLTVSSGTFTSTSTTASTVVFTGGTSSSATLTTGGTFTNTNMNWQIASGKTLINTANFGSGSLVASGKTMTVNGSFQINQGSWSGSSGTWTYGASSTLIFNNGTSSYGPIDATHVYWPSTNPPANVTLASGSQGINLSVARTISGALTLGGGVTNANNLTLNGTTTINSGGYLTGSPTYGSSSTLVYNSGTTYGRGAEWNSTDPANVQISNNTTLNYPNGTAQTAARTLTGNLTVDAGSAMYMDYGSPSTGVGTLTVNGNVTLNGNLSLGNQSGGDLVVKGNFTHNTGAAFANNSRSVTFSGTGAQSISGTNSTTTFAYFIVNKSSGTLTLNKNITVSYTAGDGLQLQNAGGFDLNGNTLTLAGAGGNILATGGARSISSTGSSTIAVTGSKTVTSASSGTLSLASGITTILTAGVDFGSAITTLNGTLRIDNGGFVTNNAPTYGSSSLLLYNTGTVFGRTAEWSSSPANVQLSNNTTLNYPNGASITKTMTGNLTIDAGSALYMDYGTPNPGVGTLTVSGNVVLNGNLSLGNLAGGDLKVGGNWTRTGVLTTNGRLVEFNGASAQSLSGTTTFDYLTINNANGLTLSSGNAIVNTALTFTNGKITTGANAVVLGSAAGVSGAGAGKYVYGKMSYTTAASGSPSYTYAIGDASNYTPVTLAFNTLSGSGTVSATTTGSAHPQIGSAAAINSSKAVSRYWSLTNSGAAFTDYSATFNFVNGDLTGSPTTGNFIVGNYNGSSWSYPTVGTRTTTSTQATGLTGFSDFAIGEIASYTITATASAGGTISPSGATTVNYGGSQSYTIGANTGYHVDSVVVNGVSQGAVTSYSFSNVTANSTIAAYFSINSFTITATAGTGGTISPNGSTSVNYGGSQAYTIAANTGYHIDSVLVGGVNQGAVTTYTFSNVTANGTIGAYFSINTYTITASANGSGTISPSGVTTLNYGGSQTYSISPATGYHIDSVLVDGANQGSVASYSFSSVSASHTIAAYFSINTYTLTVNIVGGGSVTKNPDAASYTHGTSVDLTPTAAEGYSFTGWSGDASGSSSPLTITMTANKTITATFVSNGYVVTTNATNGTVTKSPDLTLYPPHEQLVLTANPATGYHFTSWSGNLVSTKNPDTVYVDSAMNVTANFAINTYSLTVNAANGTVALAPAGGTYNHGTWVTLSATPATGYHFVSYSGDLTGANAIDSIQMTANRSVTANFAVDTFTISSSVSGTGTISPSGSSQATYGSSPRFTFAAGTGYHFDSLRVDGVTVTDSTSGYTFTNVTAGHSIVAYFSANTYTVSTSATNGTVSLNPPGGSYSFGSSVQLTATSATGYHFSNWSGDVASGQATTNPLTITVDGNKNITANFAIDTLTITTSSDANGSISPAGPVSVTYGGSQQFTFTGATGYHLDSIFVNGVYVSGSSPYTVSNVTANTTVSAKFAINTYTITVSAGAHGTITPAGPTVTLNYGASQSFSMSAASGYHISDVLIDGVSQGAVSSYNFSSVSANHTIAASFASDTTAAGVLLNGTIASGEYGSDIDGQNQQTSGGTEWHVTWDTTALYVGISGANTAEGAVIYLDKDPQTPINGGTNSNGTNAGRNYDGAQLATLQFRADLVSYFKNGYREYRRANGSNGWSSATTGFGTYADNGSSSRELAIPWSAIGGKPASFGFFGYVTSSGGFVYGQVPSENVGGSIGLSATFGRYYIVNTTDGTVKPFSRNSYVYNGSADITSFGAVSVYDFTMNTAGRTITRQADGGGAWSIGGSLNVNAGTIDFGTSTTPATVSGNVSIGSSGTIKLSTAVGGDVNIGGDLSNSGTLTTNDRAIGFVGTSAQTATGLASADYVSLNNAAGLTLANNLTVNKTLTLTSGKISTGANTLTIASTGSVSRTGGYLVGNLAKNVSTGSSVSRTFEIGDASNYTPATVQFASVSTAGTLKASTTGSAHPQVSSSGLTSGKLVNRYWTLSNTGTVFTNYNASFTFAAGDVDNGANTSNFVIRKYDDPSWNSTATGTRTSTSTQATGLTSFSDFAIGEPPVYSFTASPGANGAISPNGTVQVTEGDSARFIFTANTGYHVDSIFVDGSYAGNGSSYTFTNVTAAHTIAVSFAANTFTLSATAGTGGTITPSGSVNATYGGSQQFAIAASAGYHIDSVIVDGAKVDSANSYTFSNITADHTIRATFAVDSIAVTASAGPNGAISPSGTFYLAYGSNQAFTVTPDAHYHVDSIKVNGSYVGNGTSYSLTNVTSATTVSVSFAIDTYTVTASAGANGTVSPSGVTTVAYGGSQSVTISPNTNYRIDSVIVDGAFAGTSSPVTFTNITANHTVRAVFTLNTTAAGVLIDGTVTSGEYGVDTNGQNQETSGGTVWHVTWDTTALYVGITGANTAEGAVMYLDKNPQTPINGGTDAEGTNVGQNYDGTNFSSLQFRADLVTYFKNGYREYRTANGSNGWSGATSGYGSYADNGSSSREVSIPWSAIGGKPASFAFFGYVTSPGGFVYGEVPAENAGGAIGTAAAYGRYYVVNTTDGTVKPFSRNSYVFNRTTDLTDFGAISVYDFTMNSSGKTITRTAGAGGAWTINGSLVVNAGTVDFGSSSNTVTVNGDVSIGAGGVIALSSAVGGDLNLKGNLTNSGTLTPNNRTVGFYGTGAQTATGVATFDYLTLNNASGLTLGNDIAVNKTLSLLAGKLNTGSYKVTIGSAGTATHGSGYVNGTLAMAVPAGSSIVKSFEIGDGTSYAPATVFLNSVSAPGTITATTTAGAHPNLASSDIIAGKKVNRYWTLTNAGTAFSTYNALFTFPASEVDAGADTSKFGVRKYDSPAWSAPPTVLRTSTSAEASGLTSFSDFAIGEVPTYTITATAGANGSINPAGAVNVVAGDSATFAIAGASGYHVDSVFVDGSYIGSPSSYTFAAVLANHTISATFALTPPNTHVITATAGSNGSISPSGSVVVSDGGSQHFSISPDAGYKVATLTVDGGSVTPDTAYTFTNVIANHTIAATFVLKTYTISASAGANGTISPSGAVSVNYGANRTFSIHASAGYHIDSLIVDGSAIAIDTAYTFTNVTANHTIRATFHINQFTITASAGLNGAIAPSGSVSVNSGANQQFTFTPAGGYHVDSVIVDGSPVTTAASYTFMNITANHTIRVAFAINSYTISTTVGANGSVSPSGPVTVLHGGSVTFTFHPASGYGVDSVIVDNVAQAVADSFRFVNVTANHDLRVKFKAATYTITATAGANGSISPSGSVLVTSGAGRRFTFAPATGYGVDSVIVDDVVVDSANGFTFSNVNANHTIRVTFAPLTYTITASAGPNGTISPSGSVSVTFGDSQEFTISPNSGYVIDSVLVDESPTGNAATYTFSNVASNHTIRAVFRISAAYLTSYRTFTYDSLIVAKATKKKNITEFWEFQFDNATTSNVTEINLLFKNDVQELLSVSGGFTATGLKKSWKLTGGTLGAGQHLILTGRSPKPKAQSLVKVWLGAIDKTPDMTATVPTRDISELPMPNIAYVRDLAFAAAGISKNSPLTIGISRSDSSKMYGWVALAKSTDMYKSLVDKGTPHSTIGQGFDIYNGKAFNGAKSSLPPSKHNDKTFADLLTLKFNLLISQLGYTQRGLGELRYNVAGSPFDGMLLREIVATGDDMMTYHTQYTADAYGSLDSALAVINGAFSGPIDTTSWGDSLRLADVAQLIDVPFLRASGIAPAIIAQKKDADRILATGVPAELHLEQNYPNPFNPTTTIQFSLPEGDASVSLVVYNMLGQEVARLLDHTPMTEGQQEVAFDASKLSSGVYFYRLTADVSISDEETGATNARTFTQVRKMMLIK